MYERKGVRPLTVGLIAGACLFNAANISNLITREVEEGQADDRVEKVQEQNEQLRENLLEVTPNIVGRLVLNDEAQEFDFQSQTQNGQAETCSGEYEIKDGTAVAVGDLACTQTSPIGK